MTHRSQLLGRPTGDLLILLIGSTICATVLLAGLTIGIIELINPEEDTSTVISILSDVINTLIGLLAGFVAGRTDSQRPPLPDA